MSASTPTSPTPEKPTSPEKPTPAVIEPISYYCSEGEPPTITEASLLLEFWMQDPFPRVDPFVSFGVDLPITGIGLTDEEKSTYMQDMVDQLS